MSGNSFKSIRNGVIASVIAGVILLVIPALRNYIVKFFLWLWTGVVWCWEALVSPYSLPGWILLVVLLFALIGLVKFYIAIKGHGEEPEYKSYIEDSIYGVVWRWQWVDNQISNLWCFCPNCDATLAYDDSSCRTRFADAKKTDFLCENSDDRTIAPVNGGDKNYATGAAIREIERLIRT